MTYRLLLVIIFSFALFAGESLAAFITSKHKSDFSRLNFNWESQVEYDLKQDGNLVTIKFKRSHPLTKAQLDSQLKSDSVAVHSMSSGKDYLEITFELQKPATALTLNKGGLVVLDFVYDTPPENKKVTPEDPKPVADKTKKPEDPKTDKKVDAAEKPKGDKTPKDDKKIDKKGEKEAKAKADKKNDPKAQPKVPVPSKVDKKGKDKSKIVEDPMLAKADVEQKVSLDASQETIKPAPSPVPIQVEETVEGLRLIFDFPEASKAGAFLEAGDLWLFFDQPTQFSWDDSALKSSQLITDLVTYNSVNLSAVKIDMASEPNKVSFYNRGHQWVLETTDLQGIVPVYAEPSRADNTVLLTDAGFGEPIFAQMPGSGNPRYFIPVASGASRIGRSFSYVDFYLTPTILGVVIDPLSQGLRVEKKDHNIFVSRDGGLALSDPLDIKSNRQRFQPPSLMNFSEWTSDSEDTAQNKRNYQADIINSPKQARTPKRLELVRHYILTNRYLEARGLLAAALIYDPSLEKSPYYHSLMGLASFLAQKYDESRRSFESPILRGDPEMAVWAELSKCRYRPAEANYDILAAGAPYLSNYPSAIKNAALLLAADAAVTQKKDNSRFLSLIDEAHLLPVQKDHLEYLQTYADVVGGKAPEAINLLENYSKTMGPEFRLKSSLLLTRLKAESKSITPAQEIETLEKLRYSWSGDQNEYQLWTRLADCYCDTKDYERSLKFLRKAIRNYPKLANMDKLQQKGEKYFMDALGDKDGDLFKLIGVFQEFDIFIPRDKRRFKIHEQLIDMLVKADLVDQAMGMMDQALKDASVGDDQKIRLRTRYGLLALLNDQPEKALTALNYQPGEVMPGDLSEQRRFLAAQAYLMQGKYDTTRELLQKDGGPAAFELVSQTYLDQKDWPNLVTYTQSYVESHKKAGSPVEPEAVMRLATGLALLKKTEDLKKLRGEHLDLMAISPYKEAFELITAEDPTDFSSAGLHDELTRSQQLTKFLESYREKVKQQGLSVL